MPIKRENLPKIVTPIGVAVFPRLNQPDTKFKKEGEFSVKLRLSGEAASRLQKQIMEFYEVAYKVECQDKDKESLKRADPPFKQATTKDGEEIADTFDFNFKRRASGETKAGKKWTAVVSLVDAQGNPSKAEVWGGSKLRLSATMTPWYSASFGFGIKLDLRGAQIIELVTKGGALSASALGFDAVDGYTESANADEEAGDAEESKVLDEF